MVTAYHIGRLIAQNRDEVFHFVNKRFQVKSVPRPFVVLQKSPYGDDLFGSGYICNHQSIFLDSRVVIKNIIGFGLDPKDARTLNRYLGNALATEYSLHVVNYLNGFKLTEFSEWRTASSPEQIMPYEPHWNLVQSKLEAIGMYIGAVYYRYKGAHDLFRVEDTERKLDLTEDLHYRVAVEMASKGKTMEALKLLQLRLSFEIKIRDSNDLRSLAQNIFGLSNQDKQLLESMKPIIKHEIKVIQ